MKALVVDDSMTIRRIVIKALSDVGVTDYAEAGDGEEAMIKAKETPFDLVLLDWNMPKMSGLETIKAMRASGMTMPVIMVTTEAEKSRVIEAIRAGVNEYLIKPFTPPQLAEKMKRVVPALAGT